jgi:hypothetical protein
MRKAYKNYCHCEKRLSQPLKGVVAAVLDLDPVLVNWLPWSVKISGLQYFARASPSASY